jgi:hypothetical protein
MTYPYPLIEVVWDDACSDAGWQEAKKVKFEQQKVTTVGFLIRESRDYLIFGHTFSGDDFVGWFQLPKKMIISRKTLKRATKGKNADSKG